MSTKADVDITGAENGSSAEQKLIQESKASGDTTESPEVEQAAGDKAPESKPDSKPGPSEKQDVSALEAQYDGAFYDEIDIEDMEYDETTRAYYYPCPCGDKFFITEDDLYDGEEVANCPSCSLRIKVIYDPDEFLD